MGLRNNVVKKLMMNMIAPKSVYDEFKFKFTCLIFSEVTNKTQTKQSGHSKFFQIISFR